MRPPGRWEALAECTRRYLDAVLETAGARVVIVVGDVAAEAFRRKGFLPEQRVLESADLGRRNRVLVFLPHPNKRGGLKGFAAIGSDHFERLRATLAPYRGERSNQRA